MSRNFHNLHVHAPTARARAQVVKAVLAHAKKAGFERVKTARSADRVIRLGGKAPWFSIDDDGYGAGELAPGISKATKLPVLEAYCEASAIVWLGFFANGRAAGGWAREGLKPAPAKHVAPLLALGTPKELREAWDAGIRQVFPETALEVAAKHFGIKIAQMFGESSLRGETIALARKTEKWQPRYHEGAPAFQIGWGSNGAWGGRHLVFEGDADEHRIQITSTGGPARGFSLTFAGTAIENRHVEIVSVSHPTLKLERTGERTWSDPTAKVPAGLVERPDLFQMGQREVERARQLDWACELRPDVSYRAIKQGECELVASVESGGSTATGSLALKIQWLPWRPSVAREGVSNFELFAMHRKEHAIAHVALRGPIADAWAWVRSRIERWAVGSMRIVRDWDVVATDPTLDEVAAKLPSERTQAFQVAGQRWLFGTARVASYQLNQGDELALQLVVTAYDPRCEHDLGPLVALCDDALATGVAYSAVVYHHQYQPDTKTAFEAIALRDEDPAKLDAWQASHVRGVDKRMWLSAPLAAQLGPLPSYITTTPIGTGIRLEMPDNRPRSDLEPLITALGPLVPGR